MDDFTLHGGEAMKIIDPELLLPSLWHDLKLYY
jgi:hypothetical protein